MFSLPTDDLVSTVAHDLAAIDELLVLLLRQKVPHLLEEGEMMAAEDLVDLFVLLFGLVILADQFVEPFNVLAGH